MVKRVVVGAHYGLRDWLAQRLTAIVMLVYTVVFLAAIVVAGGFDHAGWKALFGNGIFKAFTFLTLLALFWHAWVGVRDILMDYVKPTGLRLGLQVVVIAGLVMYVAWSIQILWGGR